MRKPTLRAQWLGRQLRVFREEAGLTLKDAAEFLQRNPSTVSRIETAEYPVRRPEVLSLLDFYDVSDAQRRAEVMKLSEEVWQRGWWDRYADEVGEQFVNFVWLEAQATEIRSFETVVLPGLLQTREYAEAVIRAADPDEPEVQIASWIDLRMTRQQVLDQDDPPRLAMILDETVLRRHTGSAQSAKQQLDHLLDIAGRPHVDVRVLPLSHALRPGVSVSFVLFGMPDPYPEVGYIETLAGALYLEPPETDPLVRAYARLERHALDPEKSARLIAEIAKEMDQQ